LFLIGLVIFVWASQPLLVSIISTIPFAGLVPLVVVSLFPLVFSNPHSRRKNTVSELLEEMRSVAIENSVGATS